MPWWPEQKREHAARHVSSSLQELCSCITEGMEEGALTPYLRLAPLQGAICAGLAAPWGQYKLGASFKHRVSSITLQVHSHLRSPWAWWSTALIQEGKGSPGAPLGPIAPSWKAPRLLGEWRAQPLVGFANTVPSKWIHSSQEKPINQERSPRKRERQRFSSGAGSWARWRNQQGLSVPARWAPIVFCGETVGEGLVWRAKKGV